MSSRAFAFASLAGIVSCTLLWGVGERSLLALGLNTALFYLAVAFTLSSATETPSPFAPQHRIWSVPLLLGGVSYGLYDNYFMKLWNFLAIPCLTAILYTYALRSDRALFRWTIGFLIRIFGYLISTLVFLPVAAFQYLGWCRTFTVRGRDELWQVLLGIGILITLAAFVILPLLGSADPLFQEYYEYCATVLRELLDWETLAARAFTFMLVVSFLISGIQLSHAGAERQQGAPREFGPIVPSIVLGGLIVIYALFLLIQAERLYLSTLPLQFESTEGLVKSGFWQLLTLTGINILLVAFVHTSQHRTVAALLRVFLAASLLLLSSAGLRMGLYVLLYGLSYEKFYASYAVLYCALLLGTLIIVSCGYLRRDPIQVGVFLLVTMHTLVSLLPVERIIVETNLALAQRADSRIDLNELRILSPDVLALVDWYMDPGTRTPAAELFRRTAGETMNRWRKARQEQLREKAWYECNVLNLLYLATGDPDQRRLHN